MAQAPLLQRLALDPLTSQRDRLSASEVDVSGCEIAQAFVIYDEPEILPCASTPICLTGADGRQGRTYGAAPAGACSRAAFRNSQADMSHSAAKNPVRTTTAPGQFAPAEPNPAIRAITPTNA